MADEEKLRTQVEEKLKTMNVEATATPSQQQQCPEIPENYKQFMEETMYKALLFKNLIDNLNFNHINV